MGSLVPADRNQCPSTRHASSDRVRLLVSVRTLAEAQVAVAAGADWIDVKEPANGPLGRADVGVIAEIAQSLNDVCPLSAACGELRDLQPGDLLSLPRFGVRTVKFGLAGCLRQAPWRENWQALQESLSDATSITPVIYADHHAAQAPGAGEVFELAMQTGAPLILIDTFDKRGGNLLSHYTARDLQGMIEQFRQAGIETVLAGSLQASDIATLLPLQPYMVAVRTAACEAGRLGSVSFPRVEQLVSLLRAS